MEKIQTDNNSNLITKRSRQVFMIAFATVALFMTAYATSGGVKLFLTEPYAWIGVTALSVGFLALTSLVLGDGLSSNKIPQIILITPFFLIAVAICWILSFASYHQQFLTVGKSDLANSETNLRQMGIYAYDITKAMSDQVQDKRNTLIEGEAFSAYSTAMIGLADELRDRDNKKEIATNLQAMIEKKKTELLNRQAKLEADVSKLQNDMERRAINIRKLDNLSIEKKTKLENTQALLQQVELAIRLEEGDPSIPAGERPLIERDSLARQLVDSPACNRRRAAGKGGVIQGTCYFALTEKLTETSSALNEDKQGLEASIADLKTARQLQADEQEEVNELIAQNEIDKQKSSEEFASEFALDTDGFLQSVNAFIDQPSKQTFETNAGYCQNVTEVLADLNTGTNLPACSPQAFTAVLEQFGSLEAEQQTVNFACEESNQRDQIVENLRREISGLSGSERLAPISRAYDKMRTQVLETCLITAEQQGIATGPFRDSLASFYDRINPSQDPISQAIGKVNSLFNGTASARDYFPALLALLQELSLLLTKLFWDANSAKKPATRKDDEDYSDLDLEAKPDDPVAILAVKNLLLNTTFQKQKHLLPDMFDEEYSHQMRNHMRRFLDNLFRKKLAKKSSRGIFISEDGMTEMARQIRRHKEVTQKMDNVKQVSTSQVVGMAEVVETISASAPEVENVDELDAPQMDEQNAVTAEDPETIASEIKETDEDVIKQKARKRRPIVVRPNFRRD